MAEPTRDEQENLVAAYIDQVAKDMVEVGIRVRDWNIEIDEHLEGYIEVGDIDEDGTSLVASWREHLGWYLLLAKPQSALCDHWGDFDCLRLADPRAVTVALVEKAPLLAANSDPVSWPAPAWTAPIGYDPDAPLDAEGFPTPAFWDVIAAYLPGWPPLPEAEAAAYIEDADRTAGQLRADITRQMTLANSPLEVLHPDSGHGPDDFAEDHSEEAVDRLEQHLRSHQGLRAVPRWAADYAALDRDDAHPLKEDS